MRFSWQEYWSGLPCPPPEDLPNPGIEPPSFSLLHWQADSLPLAWIIIKSSSCFHSFGQILEGCLVHKIIFIIATMRWSYCCSASQLCQTLCDLIDCSTPGFPVLHHLPEFAQTHVLWVNDTIRTSCPLPSPSPFSLNLSQHQGLFQELALHIRWPEYWTFSFSSSSEYAGLILLTF